MALTAENAEVAEAEVILIGVKPGVVLQVIEQLGAAIEGKLVISLAAGIRVESMEEKGEGALHARDDEYAGGGLPGGDGVGARGANDGRGSWRGRARFFPRSDSSRKWRKTQIDAVTALAGSGPAFVYTVIEALAAGGTNCGLPAETSLGLATQTVRGAAQLALESKLSPEELRRMVITPGGTTAAGLAEMDKRETAAGLAAAVEAAAARGREMGLLVEASLGRPGCVSYTSTSPTPVTPPTPCMMAV